MRRNIAENFIRLSRAHERYTHTTDGRTDDDSERSLKAENTLVTLQLPKQMLRLHWFLRFSILNKKLIRR